MRVIGLTGGIASGKSTVAARLRERGVPVVDADRVAREVVATGGSVLEAVRAAFGDQVLRADGSLDREALAARVFADARERQRLEAITHPAIAARTVERLVELRRAGHPWAVYEAALILETGLRAGLDELVVVVCDPATQLARVVARDGLGEAAARRRLAAQTDNAAREAVADHLIRNDGDLEALRARTDEVAAAIEARHGRSRAG